MLDSVISNLGSAGNSFHRQITETARRKTLLTEDDLGVMPPPPPSLNAEMDPPIASAPVSPPPKAASRIGSLIGENGELNMDMLMTFSVLFLSFSSLFSHG